ncbi:hypothetical protein GF325_00600 [Candidatus Bathyarchaeota archaeon]|nr:hypothetical protein [Candidatus Bathyarchaeota archaeon]
MIDWTKFGDAVHVVRGVTDLKDTRGFYETLGFVQLDESSEPNNWVLFTDGRINLLLGKREI